MLTRRNLYLIAALVLAFTFLPWLGLTLFNTKGEPREAIVAWSMLNTGDWILPQSCGGDIPYKPPFLAWLIAAFSWLLGGEVTEYSSRLPSALATIALGLGTLRFFLRQTGSRTLAVLTAAITVTSFEVFRAASACRVDMVLTACMVLAIYAMYPSPRIRLWPVALMTCAVLTKGPVGMVLPCMVMWIFYMIRGQKFVPATIKLAVMGALSLMVPALWYWCAAAQGGDAFVNLALEENVGRMTGSMSYGSHNNPFWYNFVTLVAGMVPYTLLALLSLLAVKKTAQTTNLPTPLRSRLKTLHADPVGLLSTVAIIAIVAFYCIPSSKRSVYLLPVYPFVSYWVARLYAWLMQNKPAIIKAYAATMGGLALLLPLAMLAVKYAPMGSLLSGLKGQTMAMALGLHNWDWGVLTWALLGVCVWAGCMAWREVWHGNPWSMAGLSVACVFAIYWNLSASVLPPVLNTKSDISMAHEVQRLQPAGQVFSYIPDPLMRYYTANFYLHDRIVPYRGQRVDDNALLMVSQEDYPEFLRLYGDKLWGIVARRQKGRRSCDTRRPTLLVRLRNRPSAATQP